MPNAARNASRHGTRYLEDIVEACDRLMSPVGDGTRDAALGEPRTRDVLVHACFGIDDEIPWDIIANKVGPLHEAVAAILRDDRAGSVGPPAARLRGTEGRSGGRFARQALLAARRVSRWARRLLPSARLRSLRQPWLLSIAPE